MYFENKIFFSKFFKIFREFLVVIIIYFVICQRVRGVFRIVIFVNGGRMMFGKIINFIKSQRSCIFFGKFKYSNIIKVVLLFLLLIDSFIRYLLNNLILLNIIIRSYFFLYIYEFEIFVFDYIGDVGINISVVKKRVVRFFQFFVAFNVR